jgi:carbon monoxide dehydrogenase subunit G
VQIEQQFNVPVDPDAAYALLTDVERIAPCMPGAQLQEIEGDEYRGIVKVKVGPITTQYKGRATFVERDPAARTAVVKASGRDTRGQGNANATIQMAVRAHEDGASVAVVTDLNITGKVAQLGRGAIVDVSTKLLGTFVDSLGEILTVEGQGGAAVEAGDAADEEPSLRSGGPGCGPYAVDNGRGPSAEGPAAPVRRVISSPEPEPVELLSVAGPVALRRALPVLALVVLVLVVWRGRRCRRSRRAGR